MHRTNLVLIQQLEALDLVVFVGDVVPAVHLLQTLKRIEHREQLAHILHLLPFDVVLVKANLAHQRRIGIHASVNEAVHEKGTDGVKDGTT